MITTRCQRWRAQRATYHPVGQPIRTHEYEVATITSDTLVRAFVMAHHYAGSYVAARFRTGLYRHGELVGVAVLSQPASEAALHAALPFPGANRAELGRFVLHDDVPANGESWFLARTWELARAHGFEAIVSHSDPTARATAEGRLVFPGHIGTIYQATNAVYVGRTPRRTWRMFRDGSVLSARNLSKLRKRERGWQYVVELLIAQGATAPSGDWDRWRRLAISTTTRAIRHPGTHRYLFALEPKLRRHMPRGVAYPKFVEAHRSRVHAAAARAQMLLPWG